MKWGTFRLQSSRSCWVLENKEFERLGSTRTLKVDVRLIAATNHDLHQSIAEGRFREDLFYRVNVIEIQLPPLRERPADLPLLLRHFIQRFTAPGAAFPRISPAAWASLIQYDFPGNVRELSHAVQHAMVLSGGQEIDLQHLPPSIVDTKLPASLTAAVEGTAIRPLHLAIREFEHQYLQHALKAADGKRNRTAAMLGISRKTLWEKLRHSGLDAPAESESDENDLS